MSKQENRDCFIYVLTDPVTGEVRYVGKSVNPTFRYSSHIKNVYKYMQGLISKKSLTKCELWIKDLLEIDLMPNMYLIERCRENDQWAREHLWIAFFRSTSNILNSTQEMKRSWIRHRLPDRYTTKKLTTWDKIIGKPDDYYRRF